MIISNEQIERSIHYLQENRAARRRIEAMCTPEELSRIKAYLQHLPEVREPVVSRLRSNLSSYEIDPYQVALKMIGRLVGDSIR